jgi:SAM-dependent methyltransferase
MSSEADRITGLYQRHALSFDQDRSRALHERHWLDRFRGFIPQGGSVLDLGCGSGEPIARYLIENGHSVTGIDSSPSLIGLCEKRFPEHCWQVADMRTLSLAEKFHGIIAWNSFFHLNHTAQRAMFPIFRRHAAPGSPLMFTSGTSFGEAIGTYQGEPLYHASLDTEEYRSLLEINGFEVISHVVSDPACGHLTIWLARLA